MCTELFYVYIDLIGGLIDLIGGLIGAKMSEPDLNMKYVKHDWISYSTFIPNSS